MCECQYYLYFVCSARIERRRQCYKSHCQGYFIFFLIASSKLTTLCRKFMMQPNFTLNSIVNCYDLVRDRDDFLCSGLLYYRFLYVSSIIFQNSFSHNIVAYSIEPSASYYSAYSTQYSSNSKAKYDTPSSTSRK